MRTRTRLSVGQFRALLLLLLLAGDGDVCGALARGTSSCSTSCPLQGRGKYPGPCLLREVCPLKEVASSVGQHITASYADNTILFGCADNLQPLSELGPRPEVHVFWMPWLRKARGSHDMTLELRQLFYAEPDRSVVLVFLSNGSATNGDEFTIHVDMRQLDQYPFNISIYVSHGVTVCGVERRSLHLVPRAMKDAGNGFRWAWRRFGVIHTFVTRGHVQSNENHGNADERRLALNVGHGPKIIDGSTPPKPCSSVAALDDPAAQLQSLHTSYLMLKRFSSVHALRRPDEVTGCVLDDARVRRTCPGYRVVPTPARRLFVLEVDRPYAPSDLPFPGVHSSNSEGTHYSVYVDIVPMHHGMKISGQLVTVVLINRWFKTIHWHVNCHGLGANSSVALWVGGFRSEVILGHVTSHVDVMKLNTKQYVFKLYTLITALQGTFRTTVTAYASTAKASMFTVRVPTESPAPGTGEDFCVRSGQLLRVRTNNSVNHTACLVQFTHVHKQLASALLLQCTPIAATVTLDLTRLQHDGWNVEDMVVTVGGMRECRLKPTQTNPSVRTLTFGMDRCGAHSSEAQKSHHHFEVAVAEHVGCRAGMDCGMVSPRCTELVGATVHLPASCVAPLQHRGRHRYLAAYREAQRLLPLPSWTEIAPGTPVFFELGTAKRDVSQGQAQHPFQCRFEFPLTDGSRKSIPVLKNGCIARRSLPLKSSQRRAISSPRPGVYHFSAAVPSSVKAGIVMVLTCKAVRCRMSGNKSAVQMPLCSDIKRSCSDGQRGSMGSEGHFSLPARATATRFTAGIFFVVEGPPTGASAAPTPIKPCTPASDTGPGGAVEADTGDSDEDQINKDQASTSQQSQSGVSIVIVIGISVSTFFLGSLVTLVAARVASTRTASRQDVAGDDKAEPVQPPLMPRSLSQDTQMTHVDHRRGSTLSDYIQQGRNGSLDTPCRSQYRQKHGFSRSVSVETSLGSSTGHRSMSIMTTTTMLPTSSSGSDTGSS